MEGESPLGKPCTCLGNFQCPFHHAPLPPPPCRRLWDLESGPLPQQEASQHFSTKSKQWPSYSGKRVGLHFHSHDNLPHGSIALVILSDHRQH